MPFLIDLTIEVFSLPSKGGFPKTRRKRSTPTDHTSALAAKNKFSLSISPQILSGDIKYNDEMLFEENFLRRKPEEMQKLVKCKNLRLPKPLADMFSELLLF